jgi:multiple sugar transport system permease protein
MTPSAVPASPPRPARRIFADNRTAALFIAPFVAVYALLFVYPTLQMVWMSFTNSQLIVPGKWIGLGNYARLFGDRRFGFAVLHTFYFVALTVIPSTALGLGIAMLINRLKGRAQGFVLALFFIPYILPVATVTNIWWFMLSYPDGVLQGPIALLMGQPVHVFLTASWVLPTVALITIWWTTGFNILLFLAGLRNVPPELHEAARLDGAGRWRQFVHITLPLMWPVTALVFTIQLILQIKLFDQLYLMVREGQDATLVLVQYIYNLGFQSDRGGYASTVAVALFVIVIIVSVLQFQLLRARGGR